MILSLRLTKRKKLKDTPVKEIHKSPAQEKNSSEMYKESFERNLSKKTHTIKNYRSLKEN